MELTDERALADSLRAINKVEIFAGIALTEQRLLASRLKRVVSQPGEVVIEQGDVGDSLYIIVEGKVSVSVKPKDKERVVIATLGAGEVFGEIAILRNIPRTARITTERLSVFLTINASDFLSIYQYFPKQARDNMQLLIAKRLQNEHHRFKF